MILTTFSKDRILKTSSLYQKRAASWVKPGPAHIFYLPVNEPLLNVLATLIEKIIFHWVGWILNLCQRFGLESRCVYAWVCEIALGSGFANLFPWGQSRICCDSWSSRWPLHWPLEKLTIAGRSRALGWDGSRAVFRKHFVYSQL